MHDTNTFIGHYRLHRRARFPMPFPFLRQSANWHIYGLVARFRERYG